MAGDTSQLIKKKKVQDGEAILPFVATEDLFMSVQKLKSF